MGHLYVNPTHCNSIYSKTAYDSIKPNRANLDPSIRPACIPSSSPPGHIGRGVQVDQTFVDTHLPSVKGVGTWLTEKCQRFFVGGVCRPIGINMNPLVKYYNFKKKSLGRLGSFGGKYWKLLEIPRIDHGCRNRYAIWPGNVRKCYKSPEATGRFTKRMLTSRY